MTLYRFCVIFFHTSNLYNWYPSIDVKETKNGTLRYSRESSLCLPASAWMILLEHCHVSYLHIASSSALSATGGRVGWRSGREKKTRECIVREESIC